MDQHTTSMRWWSRWDQVLLEALLVIIAIGAVIFGVLVGLDAATADELPITVTTTDDNATSVTPERATGYRLEIDQATLFVEDPSGAERLGAVAPTILGAVIVGITATLLYEVARSIRVGDPFQRSNARRLLWAAMISLVGGMAASLAAALSSLALAEGAVDALPIAASATVSLLPIPVGIVFGVLAEVFRRGANLRDDVEGLV